jgi:dienelactone hydrolase
VNMSSKRRLWAIAFLVSMLMLALFRPVERHIAATRLLLRLKAPASMELAPRESDITDLVDDSGQPIRARMYGPDADAARLSIVLGHGIHRLGIDEPRLVSFARQLSSLGCRVLTPELSDLKDYRITASGVEVLRRSVDYLAASAGTVGLIGFSFAGGLGLLTAADPAVGSKLRYVASVGGYHDLARTLRFLATSRVEGPSGTEARPAHEYGLLILLYGHLDELGLGADESVLSSALRAWLEEDRPRAREHGAQLTTSEGRHLFELVEQGRLLELSGRVLPLVERQDAALRALSPSGRLNEVGPKIVLLHGAGDSVVPPEETLWAERELAAGFGLGSRYHALVTPLIEHVRVEAEAGLGARLELVHVIAQLR